MQLNLSENIRTFRKQRALTQEQLAEVLGVTTGAVYKWEAKLSVPDIGLIIEMADFFDTSVDVLLGYEMKDNRREMTVQRLKKCLHEKDRKGLVEAEKALKKYPYAFEVIYESATLYQVFGFEEHDKSLLRRAIELLEHSRLLLEQNNNPQISEATIYGHIAEVYCALGESDHAVQLLKKHNVGGIYNDLIGLTLASKCERQAEAVPILSEALLANVASLIRIVMGYINVFDKQKDYDSAQEILCWILDTFSGLKRKERPSFLDKVESVLYGCLAYAQLKTGNPGAARCSLIKGKELAEYFDAAPNYAADAVKFITCENFVSTHDDLGSTAAEGIKNIIHSFEDKQLAELWKEVDENEK